MSLRPEAAHSFTVIIPAYNEVNFLTDSIKHVVVAASVLRNECDAKTELIVVDNCSTDATLELAESLGARVIQSNASSIGAVRNAGAEAASGDVLVFVDADAKIHKDGLAAVWRAIDGGIVGGGFETDYRPRKRSLKIYLEMWKLLGRLMHTAQGSGQFCMRWLFEELDGYDPKLYMAEDADLQHRMRRYAKANGEHVTVIRNPPIYGSSRRFDTWPLWRSLWFTNPLVILMGRRRRQIWSGWYEDVRPPAPL